jgi:hypothetical protein
MPKLLALSPQSYGDPVIYSVPEGYGYSMPVAAQVLERLEQKADCEIGDASWKRPGYGNLAEVGIPVRLGTIEFLIMSSYGDILIYRKSGNKAKFYEFCDSVRQMEFSDAT